MDWNPAIYGVKGSINACSFCGYSNIDTKRLINASPSPYNSKFHYVSKACCINFFIWTEITTCDEVLGKFELHLLCDITKYSMTSQKLLYYWGKHLYNATLLLK